MDENNIGNAYIIFLPHCFSDTDNIDSVVSDYKKYYKKFTRCIEQYVTEIKIKLKGVEEGNSKVVNSNKLNRLHIIFNICNNIENVFSSFIEKYRNIKKYYLCTGLYSSYLLFDIIYFVTDKENNIIHYDGFFNCFISSLDNDYIIDKENEKIEIIFSSNFCVNNEKIKSICKEYLNKWEEIKNE